MNDTLKGSLISFLLAHSLSGDSTSFIGEIERKMNFSTHILTSIIYIYIYLKFEKQEQSILLRIDKWHFHSATYSKLLSVSLNMY